MQPERGSVIDGEAACDGERPNGVEGEPEEVVESESDRSSVCDTRGAYLALGETMHSFDARRRADRVQMQAGGVIWPAPGAVGRVRGQCLANLHRSLAGEVRRPP